MTAISLNDLRKAVNAAAEETSRAFPGQYVDYAGIIMDTDNSDRHGPTPTNTTIFAKTGGDGVHYSILELSETIQPVVMTVPMNSGTSLKDCNVIIGENLNEFLSIGYYAGWFPIEQLCYHRESIIEFYQNETTEADEGNIPGIHFIKKLRKTLGYNHIPLNNKRLKELEDKYFQFLQFDADFFVNM